jgi:hypothetical protein
MTTAKRCLDCGETKPLEDFPADTKRSDGRGSYCKVCMRARSRESYARRVEAQGRTIRTPQPEAPGLRVCRDCGETKPLEDFPRNKNTRSGRATYCKPCHNARSRETRQRLYGGGRHYHLKRRYGLTAAEVDALIEAQGGRCAVCRERPAEHVDHDHLTSTVRGVLCFSCNGGLGLFRDRVDVMRKAIDYLERTTWQRTLVSPGVYQLTSPRPAAAASATS